MNLLEQSVWAKIRRLVIYYFGTRIDSHCLEMKVDCHFASHVVMTVRTREMWDRDLKMRHHIGKRWSNWTCKSRISTKS